MCMRCIKAQTIQAARPERWNPKALATADQLRSQGLDGGTKPTKSTSDYDHSPRAAHICRSFHGIGQILSDNRTPACC